MFSRRSFLQFLGIAPIAAPAVINEAAKGAAGGGVVAMSPHGLLGASGAGEAFVPLQPVRYGEAVSMVFDLDTSKALSQLERVNQVARLAMRGAYRPPEASRAPKIELAGLSEYQSRLRRPARRVSARRK
jgi:hypothetical protein